MGLNFRVPPYYWTNVLALRSWLSLIVDNDDFYTLRGQLIPALKTNASFFTGSCASWQCPKKTGKASLWSLWNVKGKIQSIQSRLMRYVPTYFKTLMLTVSTGCLMNVIFTQAIVELQSEKYVKTVDEDAILQMDQKDKSLYVFSSFTTPAYQHCKMVWLNAASPVIITRSFRKVIYYFVTFSIWCSLAAGW